MWAWGRWACYGSIQNEKGETERRIRNRKRTTGNQEQGWLTRSRRTTSPSSPLSHCCSLPWENLQQTWIPPSHPPLLSQLPLNSLPLPPRPHQPRPSPHPSAPRATCTTYSWTLIPSLHPRHPPLTLLEPVLRCKRLPPPPHLQQRSLHRLNSSPLFPQSHLPFQYYHHHPHLMPHSLLYPPPAHS